MSPRKITGSPCCWWRSPRSARRRPPRSSSPRASRATSLPSGPAAAGAGRAARSSTTRSATTTRSLPSARSLPAATSSARRSPSRSRRSTAWRSTSSARRTAAAASSAFRSSTPGHHRWLAGTAGGRGAGERNPLVTDGKWHRYKIDFSPGDHTWFTPDGAQAVDPGAITGLRIMIEQNWGTPGHAYFDNISFTSAIRAAAGRGRSGSHITFHANNLPTAAPNDGGQCPGRRQRARITGKIVAQITPAATTRAAATSPTLRTGAGAGSRTSASGSTASGSGSSSPGTCCARPSGSTSTARACTGRVSAQSGREARSSPDMTTPRAPATRSGTTGSRSGTGRGAARRTRT